MVTSLVSRELLFSLSPKQMEWNQVLELRAAGHPKLLELRRMKAAEAGIKAGKKAQEKYNNIHQYLTE